MSLLPSVTAASWPTCTLATPAYIKCPSIYTRCPVTPSMLLLWPFHPRGCPCICESLSVCMSFSLEHHQLCHVCYLSLQWHHPRKPGNRSQLQGPWETYRYCRVSALKWDNPRTFEKHEVSGIFFPLKILLLKPNLFTSSVATKWIHSASIY